MFLWHVSRSLTLNNVLQAQAACKKGVWPYMFFMISWLCSLTWGLCLPQWRVNPLILTHINTHHELIQLSHLSQLNINVDIDLYLSQLSTMTFAHSIEPNLHHQTGNIQTNQHHIQAAVHSLISILIYSQLKLFHANKSTNTKRIFCSSGHTRYSSWLSAGALPPLLSCSSGHTRYSLWLSAGALPPLLSPLSRGPHDQKPCEGYL